MQDHVNPNLLFVGAETGVFFTVDGGRQWTKLAGGAPTIAFRDLVIQTRENDLVGATFGRSFFILDDYSPLRTVTSEMLQNDSVLFPVRRAHWYVQRRPLSCERTGCVDSQGHSYYVAQNPPFGAAFTYYLPEQLRSLKEQRQESEKERIAQNERRRIFLTGIVSAMKSARMHPPSCSPFPIPRAMSSAISKARSRPAFIVSRGTSVILRR